MRLQEEVDGKSGKRMANPRFRPHVNQGPLELVRNLQPASGLHPAVAILGDDISARRSLKTGDALVVDEPRIRVQLFDEVLLLQDALTLQRDLRIHFKHLLLRDAPAL